jgi:ABC-type transporter MlaC component
MLKTFKNFAALTILMCLTLGSKVYGNAPENAPHLLEECRQMVQNLGDEGIKTLKGSKADRHKREAQFRPLFVKNFDVKRIGKFVLGRYGRGNIKPGEFEEYSCDDRSQYR